MNKQQMLDNPENSLKNELGVQQIHIEMWIISNGSPVEIVVEEMLGWEICLNQQKTFPTKAFGKWGRRGFG